MSEKSKVTILGGLIVAVATIIAAIISYKAATDTPRVSVNATETAEAKNAAASAKQTSDAQTMVALASTRAVTPTFTATAWPTATPVPLTAANTPTPTSTWMPTSTRTATPSAVAWITNVSQDAQVAQFLTVFGQYRSDLQDDLWIFTKNWNGRYYPNSQFFRQSLTDNCKAETVYKRGDGQWEMPIVLGVTADKNKSFEIVLARADAAASRSLADQQHAWCLAQAFPGLEALPSDVTEIQRLRVQRTEDNPEPPADISNALVRGEVSITSVANNSTVPQEIILKGEYQKIEGDIWVLVYPFYERWYPQSMNPCRSLHTQKDDAEHWSVRTVLGGSQDAGNPFDITVVLADKEASAFFDKAQRDSCAIGYYGGLYTLQLPRGIQQKAHVRVYRGANNQ